MKREVDAEPEAATLANIDDIKRSLTATRLNPHLETRRAKARVETPTAVADVEIKPPVPRPWSSYDGPVVRRGLGLLAIVGLVAGGAALSWRMSGGPPTSESIPSEIAASTADSWQSPPLPSGRNERGAQQRKGTIPIVVLPFKTYEDTASVRTLADMMTDDLTNVLSRVRYFRVISRQTARAYSCGRSMSPTQVRSSAFGMRWKETYGRKPKVRVSVELPTPPAAPSCGRPDRTRRHNRHGVLDEMSAAWCANCKSDRIRSRGPPLERPRRRRVVLSRDGGASRRILQTDA